MPEFELVTDLAPAGDQPEAIAGARSRARERGDRFQTLLGITGSGKSFTIANVIAQAQRPTLVLAPNKSLAAQLAAEFRELFPKNRVEYFVCYYDYYQPEAYLPSTDTYIEKDSSINDEIDRLRHSATSALLTRRDVIIVASVSAIYGLGSPEMYAKQLLMLERGRGARPARDPAPARRAAVRAQRLRVRPQQVPRAGRHDRDLPGVRGAGRPHPALRRRGRAHLRASTRSPARSSRSSTRSRCSPRRTTSPTRSASKEAIAGIEAELAERLAELEGAAASCSRRSGCACAPPTTSRCCARSGAARASRTTRCTSTAAHRHQPPYTLLDYFPDDWLCVLDESHVAIPQLHGQFEGDRSRKDTLVEHGFRLPSAMDNRPLRFEEFTERVNQVVFLSATPGKYEREISTQIVEQVVRPTGLIDPEVIVKPTKGQIDDLVAEINVRVEADQRVLVTTLTKKMSEDLTDYLLELGIRVRYLHSEIDTLERIEILRSLRLGEFDVLVGINLLREGLDLPEVSLVAILDADKEGFLRSADVADPDDRARGAQRRRSGDHVRRPMTDSMTLRDLRDDAAAAEAARVQRRARHRSADRAQEGHRHPRDDPRPRRRRRRRAQPRDAGAVAAVRARGAGTDRLDLPRDELGRLIQSLTDEMHDAARDLRFEEAARLRDEIHELKRELREVG